MQTPSTASATTTEQPIFHKRKRSRETSGPNSFEQKLLQSLQSVDSMIPDDKYARFAADVSEIIRGLNNSRKEALAMREIRDVLFKYEFDEDVTQFQQL